MVRGRWDQLCSIWNFLLLVQFLVPPFMFLSILSFDLIAGV